MTQPANQTITDILAHLFASGRMIGSDRSISADEWDKHISKAEQALTAHFLACLPEKYPDPDAAYLADKIDYDGLTAQRAFNEAIDQIQANFKRGEMK